MSSISWYDSFTVSVICQTVRVQALADDPGTLKLCDSVMNNQLRTFWACHKPEEIPGWNTPVRSTKVCSTPGCGNTNLILLRTLNEKWCPDCSKSTPWGLDPGQKALA